jgi:hypothetical protein
VGGSASSECSATRPTSPGPRGIAAEEPATVRTFGSARLSASDDASMPWATHTPSPIAPAPTMPSPEPAGSRTASFTPAGSPASVASPSQDPPAFCTRVAVVGSATMKIGLVASTVPDPRVFFGASSRRPAAAAQAASSGIQMSALIWAARAGAARPSTVSTVTSRQSSPVSRAGLRYSSTGANDAAVTTRTLAAHRLDAVSTDGRLRA